MRYWIWLKVEVDAPADLPWPAISVEDLPRTVRMAFVFPTSARPEEVMRIVISPGEIRRASQDDGLIVLGELAHELVHYVSLLEEENDWDWRRPVFVNLVRHHCDQEFMRLTRGMSDILWNVYHSADTSRAIDYMARQACRRDGHWLNTRRNKR